MAFRALIKKFKLSDRRILSSKKLNLHFTRLQCCDAVSFTDRTHTCGSLQAVDIGKRVKLCGWVQHVRMEQFVVLRDWQGGVQLLIPQEKLHLREKAKDLSHETVIEVVGKVKPRIKGQENEKMKTGMIEVEVDELNILNTSAPNLPFSVGDYHKITEAVRMQYRYLDIRTKQMQRNLRLRSKFVMKMREFLINKHGFVDVETPTLFRKTPGGAKEFVVPCQHKGKFYSLPQSPQQFKQLLMVGGVDRYFQFARCYRDEGSRPDRQPEFTQLDLEMSFVRREGIMSLIEDLLVSSWPEDVGSISTPFPHMTYEQAMRLYGSDKPDTRFEMQIQDITDMQAGFKFTTQDKESVVALCIPKGQQYFTRSEVQGAIDGVLKQISPDAVSSIDPDKPPDILVLRAKDDGVWYQQRLKGDGHTLNEVDGEFVQSLSSRLQLTPRDLVFVCVKNDANNEPYSTHECLGRLRLKCADHIEKEKGVKLRNKDQFNFLWVEDFPLFLPKEDGTEGLESAHHPFTDVHPEDRHMFYTEPKKVRGQHYDLVVNGNEVGGGSIRIHNPEDQKYVLQDVLKEDSSQLKHLLEAFTTGCPPHGGIALGFDRLMSIICDAPSIRDVIAFPKTSDGKDPMSGAPVEIPQSALDLYHIQVKNPDSK